MKGLLSARAVAVLSLIWHLYGALFCLSLWIVGLGLWPFLFVGLLATYGVWRLDRWSRKLLMAEIGLLVTGLMANLVYVGGPSQVGRFWGNSTSGFWGLLAGGCFIFCCLCLPAVKAQFRREG